ncbi:MAG TPA: hypothetical protein VJ802_13000 [Gemmatimonadaceae bacterium]|nr:hypothetical protein [Gemmatimonadaceae bacterium]
MRCYYHRDVDAVATCRNCCRGLCEGCTAEVNKMSACRGRCEADVAAVQTLLARSDRAFTTAARQMRIAAFICLLFAALFVFLAQRMPYPVITWLLLPAAFVLLLGAALLVITSKRYDHRTSST